jgi:hypothetical protein
MKSFGSLSASRIVRFARLPRLNIFLQHYAFLSFYLIFYPVDNGFHIRTRLKLLRLTPALALAKDTHWFLTWLPLLRRCLFLLIRTHLLSIWQSFLISLFMRLLPLVSALVVQVELRVDQAYFLATCSWVQLFLLRFAVVGCLRLVWHWFMLLLSLRFLELRCTYQLGRVGF